MVRGWRKEEGKKELEVLDSCQSKSLSVSADQVRRGETRNRMNTGTGTRNRYGVEESESGHVK